MTFCDVWSKVIHYYFLFLICILYDLIFPSRHVLQTNHTVLFKDSAAVNTYIQEVCIISYRRKICSKLIKSPIKKFKSFKQFHICRKGAILQSNRYVACWAKTTIDANETVAKAESNSAHLFWPNRTSILLHQRFSKFKDENIRILLVGAVRNTIQWGKAVAMWAVEFPKKSKYNALAP